MKNRKKTETYRFNGHPFFHARSIFSFDIAALEERIKKYEQKLADPDDPDDKRWTTRWLERLKKELAKKEKGLALKLSEDS